MTGSSPTRATLQVGDRSYDYWSFASLPADKIERLPYSLKVLLENLLRYEDGVNVTRDDIQALLDWDAKATPSSSPRPE
jgi:aconitate hydratase